MNARKLTVEECHGEGQKLSEEARTFSVKARKVTAKARNIQCEVQQYLCATVSLSFWVTVLSYTGCPSVVRHAHMTHNTLLSFSDRTTLYYTGHAAGR